MELPQAHALAQARTCMCALADQAGSESASSAYERILIELDELHQDQGPEVYPDTLTGDGDARFALAVESIELLKQYGADALSIELILARLEDAYIQDCG